MTTLAAIPKNVREEVRVALTTWRGYRLVDVRIFAGREGNSERVPTPKGVALRPSSLPALIDAPTMALAALEASGLSEDGVGDGKAS